MRFTKKNQLEELLVNMTVKSCIINVREKKLKKLKKRFYKHMTVRKN